MITNTLYKTLRSLKLYGMLERLREYENEKSSDNLSREDWLLELLKAREIFRNPSM